jgi:hypothetical protein
MSRGVVAELRREAITAREFPKLQTNYTLHVHGTSVNTDLNTYRRAIE